MPSIIPKAIFNTVESIKQQSTLLNVSLYPTFAEKDYQCARSFLLAYKNNNATFKTYRSEIERLLQWAWLVRYKSVLKLSREDIESYIGFCQKPFKSWIGAFQTFRFITKDGQNQPNSKWRPFVANSSKSGLDFGMPV